MPTDVAEELKRLLRKHISLAEQLEICCRCGRAPRQGFDASDELAGDGLAAYATADNNMRVQLSFAAGSGWSGRHPSA